MFIKIKIIMICLSVKLLQWVHSFLNSINNLKVQNFGNKLSLSFQRIDTRLRGSDFF